MSAVKERPSLTSVQFQNLGQSLVWTKVCAEARRRIELVKNEMFDPKTTPEVAETLRLKITNLQEFWSEIECFLINSSRKG